jgi:hypothetical protein
MASARRYGESGPRCRDRRPVPRRHRGHPRRTPPEDRQRVRCHVRRVRTGQWLGHPDLPAGPWRAGITGLDRVTRGVGLRGHPRRVEPAYIVSSARPRVSVVLVRHPVIVPVAELGEIRRDLEADEGLADEVLIHLDQVVRPVPAAVVERPVLPGREGVEHLPGCGRRRRRRRLDRSAPMRAAGRPARLEYADRRPRREAPLPTTLPRPRDAPGTTRHL